MQLSLSDIARQLGASPALAGEVRGYSIDSRTASAGDLFIALKGESHDGHDYVREVLAKGAAAAIVERTFDFADRQIQVEDSLAALQSVASWARDRWGGTAVGVTGSAGKTTTKDVIASLLEGAMPVGRTVGNFNNHIGLPLSILRLPDEARVAVLEMGMNHAGEIRALAAIAKPEIGVVTNVGYAHIEAFDSIREIAAAKRELIESLPATGTAILNSDDERVAAFRSFHTGKTITYGLSPGADLRAQDVALSETGSRFTVDGVEFQTAMSGRHAIRNILAGLAVSRLFGIRLEDSREVVRTLAPGKMRGERLVHAGVTVINDCYNSNPDAAKGMLDVLGETPAQRHIAVLGEMLELGRWSEALHRDVGLYAARCGITVLVGIRGVARSMVEAATEAGSAKIAAYFFETPEEAGDWLRGYAQSGDAILFKGSRGTRVEKALEKFLD